MSASHDCLVRTPFPQTVRVDELLWHWGMTGQFGLLEHCRLSEVPGGFKQPFPTLVLDCDAKPQVAEQAPQGVHSLQANENTVRKFSHFFGIFVNLYTDTIVKKSNLKADI